MATMVRLPVHKVAALCDGGALFQGFRARGATGKAGRYLKPDDGNSNENESEDDESQTITLMPRSADTSRNFASTNTAKHIFDMVMSSSSILMLMLGIWTQRCSARI
eukprot:IDg16444t1